MHLSHSKTIILLIVTLSVVLSCQKSSRDYLRPKPSLVVNQQFDPSRLPEQTTLWYERVWSQINNDAQFPNADTMANSNNTYFYGRALNTHITTLLQLLRVTGDGRFLAEIDRLAELMRKQLKDWSILSYEGKRYEKDGYLNWQYEHDEGYQGTDVHQMDEMMSHSLAAAIAYAYQANRNLSHEYAERADFWRDYLLNHFEAKWRHRKEIQKGFPFLSIGLTHAYLQWIRYHYYMHKLTGKSGYQDEAIRMTKVLSQHISIVETPIGGAAQWTHGMEIIGEPEHEVQRMNYARYTIHAAADLALEGFDLFANEGFMENFSNMLAYFLMNEDAPLSFALRIDGTGDKRENLQRYAYSPFTQLGYWDRSGRIVDISMQAFEMFEKEPDKPRCLHIPAGLLFVKMNQKTGSETM